ncbi:MAG: 50S ribosomal protein L29 [SAR324 cluster bacterium]|nr:50S ribosomal protein L29 [SAR324 cluster bacterium]
MKPTEMRSLAAEELEGRVETWREEIFRAQCNKAVGQLQNTNVLGELRRDIARAKTIIKEKNRDAAKQSAE